MRIEFTFYAWALFRRAWETPKLLVIESGEALRYLVPKRAFVDPADVERARGLLQGVLPDCKFLVQPGGFPMMPLPVLPPA